MKELYWTSWVTADDDIFAGVIVVAAKGPHDAYKIGRGALIAQAPQLVGRPIDGIAAGPMAPEDANCVPAEAIGKYYSTIEEINKAMPNIQTAKLSELEADQQIAEMWPEDGNFYLA